MFDRIIKLFVLLIVSIIFSYGCAMNKAQTGGTIGVLGGAAVGAQVGKSKDRRKNAIIGALVGGVLGYIVGNEMDKYDRQHLNDTFEKVPSNQKVSWVNPDTNNKYTVTPRPAYRKNGKICRDAYIQAVVNGEYKQIKTTACRNPNGQWQIQN